MKQQMAFPDWTAPQLSGKIEKKGISICTSLPKLLKARMDHLLHQRSAFYQSDAIQLEIRAAVHHVELHSIMHVMEVWHLAGELPEFAKHPD